MAKWDAYYPDCTKKCGNKTSHKSGLCSNCRTTPCKKCKNPTSVFEVHCSKCKSILKNSQLRKDVASVSGVFLK